MKAFAFTFSGLVIVIILIVAIIGSLFWSRLPDMLANSLSQKLKVTVGINNIRAGWNEIDINKIQIANIPQSVLSNAFTCNQMAIKAPYSAYFNNHVIIDEIDLNGVYLGLEFDSASGASGNWTKIMSQLQQPQGHHKKHKNTPPPPATTNHTILIHKLILTDIDTDVVYRKEGSKIKKLPRIPRLELTDISSEGGVPINQLMNSILGNMLKQVFIKQNLNNMLQEFLKQANPLQDYLNPLKGLLNAIPSEENQESKKF